MILMVILYLFIKLHNNYTNTNCLNDRLILPLQYMGSSSVLSGFLHLVLCKRKFEQS